MDIILASCRFVTLGYCIPRFPNHYSAVIYLRLRPVSQLDNSSPQDYQRLMPSVAPSHTLLVTFGTVHKKRDIAWETKYALGQQDVLASGLQVFDHLHGINKGKRGQERERGMVKVKAYPKRHKRYGRRKDRNVTTLLARQSHRRPLPPFKTTDRHTTFPSRHSSSTSNLTPVWLARPSHTTPRSHLSTHARTHHNSYHETKAYPHTI
jgi:hypothetical protein